MTELIKETDPPITERINFQERKCTGNRQDIEKGAITKETDGANFTGRKTDKREDNSGECRPAIKRDR